MPKKSGQKRAEKVKKREQKKEADAKRWMPSDDVASRLGSGLFEADDLDESQELGAPVGLSPEDLDASQIRRLMEREMSGLFGRQFGGSVADDPRAAALQQAQELCFQAMEERSAKKIEKLARQALKVCADCAEAYNILAELSDNVTESLGFFEAGVAAGRRSLADEWDGLVADDAFWSYLPSRPFLRAMQGKAQALWGVGRRSEALETFQEMLRLNPNDNQGVRDVVVPMLIEMNRDDEAWKILNFYKNEGSCFSDFNRALLEFRRSGDGAKSQKALRKAMKTNRYAVTEILRDRPSIELPDSYTWQSPEEAQCYVDLARGAWKMTSGALAWLRKTTKDDPPVTVAKATRWEDDGGDETDELRSLPQSQECWEVNLVKWNDASSHVAGVDGIEEPWTLNLNRSSDLLPIDTEVFEVLPSADDVWLFLADAMSAPSHAEPMRPAAIEFLDDWLHGELADRLRDIDVDASLPDDAAERREEAIASLASAERHQGPLSELPQTDEVWILDCRQIDMFLPNDEGEMSRPWVFLVMSPERGMVHMLVSANAPGDADWTAVLEQAIRQPKEEEPRRPAVVAVTSNDHRLLVAPFCHRHDIDCQVGDPEFLAPMGTVFEALSQQMRGSKPRTAYIELPGMTSEQLESFFEASASFYRRAPWQFTPTDAVWRVELSDGSGQPWWGVVIGQNGETFGLALYDNWQSLVGMMTGMIGGPDVVSSVSCVCFNFEEPNVLSGADLDAIEQFGWPIPTSAAYPLVYRTKPGSELHTPPTSEFRWLETILRTLPDFIASGQTTGTSLAELHDGACEIKLTKLKPQDLRAAKPTGKPKPRRS